MKPVRVYLDTSDFSEFAKRKEGSEVERLLNDLLQRVDLGVAEFGFSYLHILELFDPTQKAHLPNECLKGKELARLCKGKAFPHLEDFSRGFEFPNDGIWTPRNASKPRPKEALIESALRSLSKRLKNDPKLPRKLRRKLLTKSGLREFVAGSTAGIGSAAVNDLGIPGMADLRRVLLGRTKDAEIYDRLSSILFDPEKYSEVLSLLGDGNPLRAFHQGVLDKVWVGLQTCLRERNEIESKIHQIYRKHQEVCRELEALGKDVTEEKRRMKLLVKSARKPLRRISLGLEERTGSDQLRHIDHWFNRVLGDGRMPKKDSEITDVLHLVYAQQCDLVRVDARVAEVFKDYAPFKGKLVSDRFELVDRIDALFEQA